MSDYEEFDVYDNHSQQPDPQPAEPVKRPRGRPRKQPIASTTTTKTSATTATAASAASAAPAVPSETIHIKEFDLNDIPPHKPSDNSGVKIVVIGKAGCFAEGTKVLMYSGHVKNIEDIEVGEQVMGNDNTPRTVQKLHRGEQPMFTVQPSDGSDSYTVNLMHDLVLVKRTLDRPMLIVSVQSFLQWSQSEQSQWQILRSSQIEFNKQPIRADPYRTGHDAVHCDDIFLIPAEFKVNTSDIRRRVLEGFLSSATVFTTNEYHVTLKADKFRVVEDMLFIARSLGFKATSTRGWNIHNEAVFLVRIHANLCLNTDLPFVSQRAQHNTQQYCDFTLVSQGIDSYYGFELDGNRLFLLASFDVVKNTGKSTLVQALLASKAHLAPVIQVFNGTEDSNGMYSKHCPPVFIYNKLDLNAMIQFRNRQTIAGKHITENPWAIQVIDDCTDDPKILRHPIFQEYYKNGRHWHMIHILSLQYSLDIMPNIRSNIDYTFLLRESSKKNRKKLYENYCPDCVQSQEDFNALMDALTENYGALVICNRTTSNKIEDCIFYCKIDPNGISPAWRFGHQTAWDFSNERFDPDYVDTVIKA